MSFFLFLLLPGVVLAGEARILSLSGNVEARQTREGQWASASANLEIPEGGAIRTGADGSAVLYMPNKTKVWLKESSALEVEQRQTLSSRLALMFGKMKIRVPHLMRKEKFEVRTPAAVCAVRGTEFTMEATEDGKMNLQVLFGEVKLKYTVPPEKGKAEFDIVQGQGLNIEEAGKSAKPALLDPKSEREALENWNPGLQPEERQKDLKEKENDRSQIKEFAKTTNSTESSVKGFLNVVKESDLEAGRTLNDVHGNLVRVDQRMVRPDNSTIQFYNIVKRPDYAAYTNTNTEAATHGFAYYGGAVANRLDLLQMNIGFNKELPQRIEEWPSFFDGNDVKASYMSTIMANRTNVAGASNIFFIATGAKYVGGTTDDLVNDPYQLLGFNTGSEDGIIITGVLTDDANYKAVEGLTKISRLEISNDGGSGSTSGGLVYVENGAANPLHVVGSAIAGSVVWAQNASGANTSYSYSSDDANSDQLYNYSAKLFNVGGSASGSYGKFWYTTESYVIGNGGNIKTTGDFTNSSSDPFSILKDSGGEIIMAIKKYNSAGSPPDPVTGGNISEKLTTIDNSSNGDYFGALAGGKKNIDIVFIPDLFVAAVQRMLPALSKIGD